MPKPACVRCKCFYRVKTNGVRVIEGMPNGTGGSNEEIRGRRRPSAWQPYKLWVADLWECPDCGHELVSGWGQQLVLERHHEMFGHKLLADLEVNDC